MKEDSLSLSGEAVLELAVRLAQSREVVPGEHGPSDNPLEAPDGDRRVHVFEVLVLLVQQPDVVVAERERMRTSVKKTGRVASVWD